MKLKHLMTAALAVVLVTSCSTPKIGYFQDVKAGDVHSLANPDYVKINPGDKLSILVSSKNPQLAYLFNLPIVGNYDASSSHASLNSSRVANYKVDAEGNIDFPVLGRLHVAGLNRSEIALYIKSELVKQDLLKDPIVTVDFLDLYFSVMGEVHRPGRFIIDHDKVTLLDALSQAGDMTIFGKRDNVLVLRPDASGNMIAYNVDMRSFETVHNSPAYYIHQNDYIYVEPNKKRANQSTVNANTVESVSFWISVASFLASMATTVSILMIRWGPQNR